MKVMEHVFCSVYLFKKRLFVRRVENARGPNCAVFPPKELDIAIDADRLAVEIEAALMDYRELGRKIEPEEWAERNKRLLEFFGESSISAFERKKKEVTVRRETATGQVALFGPKDKEVELDNPTGQQLGQVVKDLLGLK